MDKLWASLWVLLNFPGLLIFFLLESMFPMLKHEVLEIVALTGQWTLYGFIAVMIIRGFLRRERC